MHKEIIYGEEARAKLRAGVSAVAKAVITTLGPKGRNVGIAKPYGERTHVVHDGVTVARSIELKDLFENEGAKMAKEASSKTNDIAGDGTTTSMVIADAIVDEGLKNVTAGANPMLIKNGIQVAADFVNKWLLDNAKQIESIDQMRQVATISSANPELGNLVAEAIEKVGREGTVTAEESQQLETKVEYKEGMEIEGGLVSPHFINDPARGEASLQDCYVLVTDRTIDSPTEMVDFLNGVISIADKEPNQQRNIVVFAKNVEAGALATMVVNNMQGTLKCFAVTGPRGDQKMADAMGDIAALVGATVLSGDTGIELNNVTQDQLGYANRIIAGKEKTIIVADSEATTAGRIEMLREELAEAKGPIEAERIEDRIARLQGGIAVIDVGAPSVTEAKEKLERVKDAIGATKAALSEGVLPGGGVALVRAADALTAHAKAKLEDELSPEEMVGVKIVIHALERPLWHIANNAGKKADHIVEEVKKEKDQVTGYEVISDSFGDMIELGVIDPVKVSRHAVIHGCSVGQMIITTECLVVEIENDKGGENE